MKLLLKLSALVLLAKFSFALQAQETNPTKQVNTVSNHSISVDILSLTYNYEYALGKKFSLTGRAGFQSAYGYSSFYGSAFIISPAISLEPRYYYNLSRRERKEKRTNKNSANYLALTSWYIFDPIYSNQASGENFALIAPNWGIRRVNSKAFLFEFNTGISYSIGEYIDNNIGFLISLRFGYVF